MPHTLHCPLPVQERTILQFGKVAKDAFTMDFSYPMTALQVGWCLGGQGGTGAAIKIGLDGRSAFFMGHWEQREGHAFITQPAAANPLSRQAFFISLSSMDSKLACE